MSYAAAPARPSLEATSGAVAGQGRSGVLVATTTVSAGAPPADRRARAPASTAKSDVAAPGPATWRWAMPVRARIHSSEVASRSEISALVTRVGGSHPPTPARTGWLFTVTLAFSLAFGHS